MRVVGTYDTNCDMREKHKRWGVWLFFILLFVSLPLAPRLTHGFLRVAVFHCKL